MIPVLITTDSSKRGVFMGYINPKDADKEIIEVFDLRMVVYWSTDVRGVVGLAATGPTKGCKVTKAAKRGIIKGVTAVMECTSEAVKAWEKEPWKE
jgi:hypothetical protein